MGTVANFEGDAERQVAAAREAVEALDETPEGPGWFYLTNLGGALIQAAERTEAKAVLDRALLATVGDLEGWASVSVNLALLASDLGETDDALRHGKNGLEGFLQLHGPSHLHTLDAQRIYGTALIETDPSAAIVELERVLEGEIRIDPTSIDAAFARENLAKALTEAGDLERAEAEVLRAITQLDDSQGSRQSGVAICWARLGDIRERRGNEAGAKEAYARALALASGNDRLSESIRENLAEGTEFVSMPPP